jgi:hypothetical protein
MPKRQDDTGPHLQISEVTGLDDVLRDATSRRRRYVQTAALGVVLVVVVVALIHQAIPSFGTLNPPGKITAFQFISPTQVGVAGSGQALEPNVIMLQTNINYGLTLNGKPVQLGNDGYVHLRTGPNELALNAQPFQPMSCTLTWPLAPGDGNCMMNGSSSYGSDPNEVADVNFQVALSDLPDAQQSTLVTFVHHAVAAAVAPLATHVPAGQYYPYGYDQNGVPQSRLTSMPLNAQVTVQLKSLTYNRCQNVLCPGFTDPLMIDTGSPQVNFQIGDDVGWRFTTTDGVSIDTFSATAPKNLGPDYISPLNLNVTYDAAHGWSVVSDQGESASNLMNMMQGQVLSNLCQAGSGNIMAALGATQGNTNSGTTSGQATIEGCTQTFSPNQVTQGTFIVRFGALLAADAEAHKLLPSIPIAPKAEIDAVNAG